MDQAGPSGRAASRWPQRCGNYGLSWEGGIGRFTMRVAFSGFCNEAAARRPACWHASKDTEQAVVPGHRRGEMRPNTCHGKS